MKTRTFQEIYDFCRTDDTYRSYFEASDESCITGARARKYYYGDIRRGQCRVGTFIYCQSMRQLERFLEGARQDHYIHVDPPACRSEPQGRYVPRPDRLYRGTCQEAGCAD